MNSETPKPIEWGPVPRFLLGAIAGLVLWILALWIFGREASGQPDTFSPAAPRTIKDLVVRVGPNTGAFFPAPAPTNNSFIAFTNFYSYDQIFFSDTYGSNRHSIQMGGGPDPENPVSSFYMEWNPTHGQYDGTWWRGGEMQVNSPAIGLALGYDSGFTTYWANRRLQIGVGNGHHAHVDLYTDSLGTKDYSTNGYSLPIRFYCVSSNGTSQYPAIQGWNLDANGGNGSSNLRFWYHFDNGAVAEAGLNYYNWNIGSSVPALDMTYNGGVNNAGLQRFFGQVAITNLIGGIAAVGANIAGTDLPLAGGVSTGTGRGGSIILKTAPSGSSGSSANGLVQRSYVSAKEVTLTEATPTTIFSFTIASGKSASLRIFASTRADDATNFEMRGDSFVVGAVNKAGTLSTGISTIGTGDTAVGTSSGTLTTAWTVVDAGSGVLQIKNSATSSLTQTTLACFWRVDIDSNDTALSVTPQ